MIDPVAFSIAGKDVYWYGIVMSIAVFSAVMLAIHTARKKGYHPDLVVDLGLLAIPMALVFARVYYVIFSWSEFADNPVRMFYIWEGGIAIYGCLIGGVLAGLIFAFWKKTSMWDLMDIAAPSLILGQAIGRWGNFFNQEVYGIAVTNKALQFFPFAVYVQKPFSGSSWHLALFFYEFIWNLLVFGLLAWYSRKPRPRGNSFFLYLLTYSIGRIVMEGLRDPQYALMLGNTGVRVSQLLSAVLIVGCGLMMVMRSKAPRTDLPALGRYERETYLEAHKKPAKGDAA